MAQNIVYFLGAGFTKAIAPNAPNGRQFFEKGFAPESHLLGLDQIKKLKKFVESVYYPIRNSEALPRIEDVMSLVDYCIQQKQGLNRSVDRWEEAPSKAPDTQAASPRRSPSTTKSRALNRTESHDFPIYYWLN